MSLYNPKHAQSMRKPRKDFSWGATVSLAMGAVCPHQLINTNRRPFILPVKVTTSWRLHSPFQLCSRALFMLPGSVKALHPTSSWRLWIRCVQQPLLKLFLIRIFSKEPCNNATTQHQAEPEYSQLGNARGQWQVSHWQPRDMSSPPQRGNHMWVHRDARCH
jgi:hypothetical protein